MAAALSAFFLVVWTLVLADLGLGRGAMAFFARAIGVFKEKGCLAMMKMCCVSIQTRVASLFQGTVYPINFHRQMCLKTQTANYGTIYNFDGWREEVNKELRQVLFDIYSDRKNIPAYTEQWMVSNNYITVSHGDLVYLE